MDRPIRWRKRAGYFAQYLAIRLLFGLLHLLPVDSASAVGGRFGRCIGPRLRRHAVARANMRRALPELSKGAVEAALSEMWDNLGRTFAEYAHLATLAQALAAGDRRIEVHGREHVDAAIAAGKGAILFGGHFANWELSVLLQTLTPVEAVLVYRQQNNPWIDRLLARLRTAHASALAPKGAAGARDMIGALRRGGLVGVLVDQKYNEGVAVPFFGRPAMTVSGPAGLALRRAIPLIPVRIERIAGATFRVTVLPPLALPPSNNGESGLQALLGDMNALLETWIRARPGQWYWVHQRWPRDGQPID
jgi:KDO2-lipid IV(A) lauroyltransferase